ncbi:MAG: DUF362 domain-containing protein [Anaerolineales bacterium]
MPKKNFSGRGKVAVVRTRPESVLDDYDRLLELVHYRDVLAREKKTLLKINISWQTWYPACSTTPWQLEGVIRTLQRAGYELLGVHNDTVVVDTSDGERNNKQRYVTDKYDVPCVYIYKPEEKWVRYEPQEPFLVLSDIYPEGVFIPEVLIGNNIVQLPTVKTHVFTTITGAMKNAFGGLLGRKRHWTHSVIHETLVDLLQIQQDIHPGLLAVMDGTFAGDGPGPRAMHWHAKNVLLASTDQVAIDAASAMLQGFNPMEIPFIRIAHELGLGVGDPQEIEFVGDEEATAERWDFEQDDTFASRGQKMIYHGRLKPFEEFLLRGPIVPWSYFASNFYHNVYWYPVVGRKRVESALDTPWGRLFTQYGADAGLEGAVLPSIETKTVLEGLGFLGAGALALGGLAAVLGLSRARK